MTDIERKEIKGITVSLLRGIIIQTALIISGACAFYFTLKSDINALNIKRDEDSRYLDLKFQQLQNQNNLFQRQIETITFKLDELQKQKK